MRALGIFAAFLTAGKLLTADVHAQNIEEPTWTTQDAGLVALCKEIARTDQRFIGNDKLETYLFRFVTQCKADGSMSGQFLICNANNGGQTYSGEETPQSFSTDLLMWEQLLPLGWELLNRSDKDSQGFKDRYPHMRERMESMQNEVDRARQFQNSGDKRCPAVS